MKTERLYYSDNHLKTFAAQVLKSSEREDGLSEVILDRTAFYPEGGGQPGDKGFIDGIRVIDTKEMEDGIVHVCEGISFQPGQTVTGTVDWQRRFDIMQQHSGEHIISGLIHKTYGYDNVGFHIGEDYATLDMNGTLDQTQLTDLENRTNEAIWANLPILTETPLPEELANMEYRSKKELTGEVRIVTIPGYDVCACCGVHVSSTGEIGSLKVVDFKRYKSGVRITIRCGNRALRDHREKQCSVTEISRLLSAKPEETAEAVKALLRSYENTKYQLGAQEEKLIRHAASLVSADTRKVCLITEGISADGVWKYASYLAERYDQATVFSKNTDGFSYSAVFSFGEPKELCREINMALSGRGGGRGNAVRGSVSCSAEEIHSFFRKRIDGWSIF